MKRILILVFVLIVGYASAQSPSLKTSVDRTAILIGEQLKYTVEAGVAANNYNLTWFSVPDSFNHFEVVNRGKIDTIENNGSFIFKQTLTITSFDSGINTIPSLPIDFEPQTGDTTLHLFTDSIPVNVSFSPLDSTQTFHDIKTIIEVKDEIPLWMWIAGGALAVLLILFIIYLIKYFKKRKKPESLFNSRLSPIDEILIAACWF